MSTETCIRITGTRSGKLRARVEQPHQPRFEVTLGGDKWDGLDRDLQVQIANHAQGYVHHLMDELSKLRRARIFKALRPLRCSSERYPS